MADKKKNELDHTKPDANRDPITGAPGAHPLGVGAGAAGGAATGATVGAIGGPVGSAVGAAVGGVAGGLAGKAAAEKVNPTVEDGYWREHYASRPYAKAGKSYDVYRPAYQMGWEGAGRYGELNWDKAEARFRDDWNKTRGNSNLSWDEAREATRDAWNRVRPSSDNKSR
jgi:hypothetical protein